MLINEGIEGSLLILITYNHFNISQTYKLLMGFSLSLFYFFDRHCVRFECVYVLACFDFRFLSESAICLWRHFITLGLVSSFLRRVNVLIWKKFFLPSTLSVSPVNGRRVLSLWVVGMLFFHFEIYAHGYCLLFVNSLPTCLRFFCPRLAKVVHNTFHFPAAYS